ncbi:unnamed protein product [Notodromas monacha]|uniref:Sulfatase N-terminal domain-containing protein n=2 Tax=Notodromas monacha TaxID=399045 RepID=A0A7R9GD88_9CRUS|nr:unnamed protein product [Notodromas monacha]CAG0916669.1 unnamed protein product [Notodromas monacha]
MTQIVRLFAGILPTIVLSPVLVAPAFNFDGMNSDVDGQEQYRGVVYRGSEEDEFDREYKGSLFRSNGIPPNIVFILADDLDLTLEGMTPLEKTKEILGSGGATFSNMFATTPICCPSRSSILTGQYQHNHQVLNNSIPGNCYGDTWRAVHEEKFSFAPYLKSMGYTTFYAGKYLNQYGHERAGGIRRIPIGWDHWAGLVGNSVYYNYTLSVDGNPEEHGDRPDEDYLTNVIKNKSLDFLAKYEPETNGPLFMFIAPPAPHAPYTPEPKYEKAYSYVRALRTPNFNTDNVDDKHWLLRQGPHPLPAGVVDEVDEFFRDRWRSLLSVDDLVSDVYNSLAEKGMIDNTFIVFTSDHGYHLGQFSQPIDKRQPYEFDIRVPLYVRGPGVEAGSTRNEVVLNIDLAPTFMQMAGLQPLKSMDGESFLPHMSRKLGNHGLIPDGRKLFLVEYHGEGSKMVNEQCTDDTNMEGCRPDLACKCQDSTNNTYACIRNVEEHLDFLYCQFQDMEHFEEFYDIRHDPYQLVNQAGSLQGGWRKDFRKALKSLSQCFGVECHQLSGASFDRQVPMAELMHNPMNSR